MQLPVDVKAIFDAATDIESARAMPLSVSVLIDDTAPGDLTAHVRNAFASAHASVRVTIGYLGDSLAKPHAGDNMVVLVAGLSERMGAHAKSVRDAGVPAMVATTLPRLVEDMANATGVPIPAGDVVFPEKVSRCPLAALRLADDGSLSKVGSFFGALKGSAGLCGSASKVDAEPAAPGQPAEPAAPEEPMVLDGQARANFDERMGEWIIDACADKRLAFALAFPFARRPLSVESVYATSAQNAGIGLVAFIPGADMPIMTLNQAKMLLQIAAAYGEPLDKGRVKELAAVVGGAFACRAAARQLVGVVPGLGWAVKAGIGYAGTFAMGRAAIEYFEGGGNVSGVASVVAAARDKAAGAVRAARAKACG